MPPTHPTHPTHPILADTVSKAVHHRRKMATNVHVFLYFCLFVVVFSPYTCTVRVVSLPYWLCSSSLLHSAGSDRQLVRSSNRTDGGRLPAVALLRPCLSDCRVVAAVFVVRSLSYQYHTVYFEVKTKITMEIATVRTTATTTTTSTTNNNKGITGQQDAQTDNRQTDKLLVRFGKVTLLAKQRDFPPLTYFLPF
jgi:hypothetical protein